MSRTPEDKRERTPPAPEDTEASMHDATAELGELSEGEEWIDEPEGEDAEHAESEEHDSLGEADESISDSDEMDVDANHPLGARLQALAGLIPGVSSRVRSLLGALQNSKRDPGMRLMVLQELSELLSVSTEDSLMAGFPTEPVVKELVAVLRGREGGAAHEELELEGLDDESLNAVLAAMDGDGDSGGEIQMLACRCLAYLIEVLPAASHAVVKNGAVPVIIEKLQNITFIDLAEQALQTLEKISKYHTTDIVKHNGMLAMLQYLDFFNIHVQRTAMSTVANCSRKLGLSTARYVENVAPVIHNVLGYADQRLVECASRFVCNVVQAYSGHAELLERLLLHTGILASVCALLAPDVGGAPRTAPAPSSGTYTDLLRALALAARASTAIAIALYENKMIETVYFLLTGSAAPAATAEHTLPQASEAEMRATEVAVVAPQGGEGAASAVADVAVLENLAHRPKAQVTEALALISELLPPLPRTGIFDDHAYTQHAYILQKRRAEKAAATGEPAKPLSSRVSSAVVREERQAAQRMEQQRAVPNFVKRYAELVLPLLIEVYTASVTFSVRAKALTAVLKTLWYIDTETLTPVLDDVPLAGFLGGLLAAREHPLFVGSALQAVELLITKLPGIYRSLLARSGVVWEVEHIAQGTAQSTARGVSDEMVAAAWRAKIVDDRLEALHALDEPDQGINHARRLLERMQQQAAALGGAAMEQEPAARAALAGLVDMLTQGEQPISSFELLRSGFIEAVCAFATDLEPHGVPVERRRGLLRDALAEPRGAGNAATVLARRLHENIGRLENLEITTVLSGGSDDTAQSTSVLSRQMRLRLQADEASAGELPEGCRNMVVTIHGIATLQALYDHLRPRISLALSSRERGGRGVRGSSLSGILAAFAAAAREEGGLLEGMDDAELDGEDGEQDGAEHAAHSPRDERSGSLSSRMLENLLGEAEDEQPGEDTQTIEEPDEEMDGSGLSAARDEAQESRENPPGSSHKGSYASVAQARSGDWHLEFLVGEEVVPLDTTVYGCVHRAEAAHDEASGPSVWSRPHLLRFRKVPGAAPSSAQQRSEPAVPERANPYEMPLPPCVPGDSPFALVLRLLSVLRQLSEEAVAETSADQQPRRLLGEVDFVNNKLTAKLNRQFEEPMIVASRCLPAWATELPRMLPFLFPFETRFVFFRSTAFGYARLLNYWRQHEAGGGARSDDALGVLGRLPRQKVRISRESILPSAIKVLELYGKGPSILEVEYFEEVGSGLGPTLEFYALVSREFVRADLDLWRVEKTSRVGDAEYVHNTHGVFPAPLPPGKKAARSLQLFYSLGQFVAKSLLDTRIIDIHFSPLFLSAVLGVEPPATLAALSFVDPSLARSLALMPTMPAEQLETMALDFTLPGAAHVELVEGGAQRSVTAENVGEYVERTLHCVLHESVREQVESFRSGFGSILPLDALRVFRADELAMLFGQSEEDWSEATLRRSLVPDHGFNSESRQFQDLIAILAGFSVEERRTFLQWLTGSPRLPIGGFAGLHPPLTVVKRQHEEPLKPDDYLPSVMTCANYLKVPFYSSREMLHERLVKAMNEGLTSFHLS